VFTDGGIKATFDLLLRDRVLSVKQSRD